MIRFVPRVAEEQGMLTGYPAWMSRLLISRGVTDDRAAEMFLHPAMRDLNDPFLLHDMDRAVALLSGIAQRGVKTVVYGDYDVDGVCASAILLEALSGYGIPAGRYIPDRHEEGYGLNLAAMEKLSREYGAIVTVDCGITAVEEIALAKARGMTVILIDHHRPPEALPPADAVVSPMLGDYPFPSLCGAGVAWKLAQALLGDAGEWLDLCALATIADMVPLTGENRVLAYEGLRAITRTARLGLKALKEIAGVSGDVTSEQVAFALAPRMNAGGRMESAALALDLMLTKDESEAKLLADRLDTCNAERRRAESDVLAAAEEQLQMMDLTRCRAIVLCGKDWPGGVIGLAAGRIAERYGYPTVVFTRENENVVGSARSAGEIDLYEALKCESDLYLRFGGHRQAAGLTMPHRHLDEFARRFSDAVEAQLGGGVPIPTLYYDGVLSLDDFSLETLDSLDALAPFGIGNPAPRFLLQGLEGVEMRPVGAEGKHLRVTFSQDGILRSGVMFGGGGSAAPAGARYTVLATPSRNAYRGRVSAEMRVHALTPEMESIPMDDIRLLSALLPHLAGEEAAVPLASLPPLRPQGDLLLCRTRETALAMKAAYPNADFVMDEARDARAYTAIALCLPPEHILAPYMRVFLCDGDFGETASMKKCRPDVSVYALPRTQAAKALLATADVALPDLRRVYKAALSGAPALDTVAQSASVTPVQALSALYILSDVNLVLFTPAPFSLSVLPPVKVNPEACARYRLLHAAGTEIHQTASPQEGENG